MVGENVVLILNLVNFVDVIKLWYFIIEFEDCGGYFLVLNVDFEFK